MNRIIEVAYMPGDGNSPEMMETAWKTAEPFAKRDGYNLARVIVLMGYAAWNAGMGDTLPEESYKTATKIGTIAFGGVGDPKFDRTIGREHPELKPEARCLLGIRDGWGLRFNMRPFIFYPELSSISNMKEDKLRLETLAAHGIPPTGLEWHFARCTLEGSYFGTQNIGPTIPNRESHGILMKSEVRGDEERVVGLNYYTRSGLIEYFTSAFTYAREMGLPVIPVTKSNILPAYVFYDSVFREVRESFPDVEVHDFVYVDAANSWMWTQPWSLHGVIVCGNMQGDILSDGGAGALGSMGLMCSKTISPKTGAAFFESGAGTAAGLPPNTANPIGRILTMAMLLHHKGAVNAAEALTRAVRRALVDGWRTRDIVTPGTPENMIIGTTEMGRKISAFAT